MARSFLWSFQPPRRDFQAVIKSAASAASPPHKKLVENCTEFLFGHFLALCVGMPLGAYWELLRQLRSALPPGRAEAQCVLTVAESKKKDIFFIFFNDFLVNFGIFSGLGSR